MPRSRRLSKYDRLQALIRNPHYLKELKEVKGGFNLKQHQNFLKKYSLLAPVDRDLVEKYTPEHWEKELVFIDDQPVHEKLKSPPKRVEINPEKLGYKSCKKIRECVFETKYGDELISFGYDYSDNFKDEKTITLKIDLTKNKKEIISRVCSIIDYYQKRYIPESKTRKRPDQKIDRFWVWDEYLKLRSFKKIAQQCHADRTTVRKAYLRAFRDIIGEEYDPIKHDRNRIEKEQLTQTCDQCEERIECDTPCPEILGYIEQDEVKRRDGFTKERIPDADRRLRSEKK